MSAYTQLKNLTRTSNFDSEKVDYRKIQKLITNCISEYEDMDIGYWKELVIGATNIPNLVNILRIKFNVIFKLGERWSLEKTKSFLTEKEQKLLRKIYIFTICDRFDYIYELTMEVDNIIQKWDIKISPEEIDWISLASRNNHNFHNHVKNFKYTHNYDFSNVLLNCVMHINSNLYPMLDTVKVLIIEGFRLSEKEIKNVDSFTGSTKNTEVYKFLVEHFVK